MAKKARDPVQFTYESAERIASVVRAAELSSPPGAALTFKRLPSAAPRVPSQVRAATFTGSWSVNAMKVVTFTNPATATASVHNISWPITHNHVTPENCIVGKDGTSWYLVVPVLQQATAVFITQTESVPRITDVAISATLNTNSCVISVGKTLTTTSMTIVSQTATATFLKLRVP